MADKNEGADKKAHPPAPAPPGRLSYAQVVTAPGEDKGIDGGGKAESRGPTGPENSRADSVGVGEQAGGVENGRKRAETSLTIEEEDTEAQNVNHKDSKPPVETLEPSEIEYEPTSEVEVEPSGFEVVPRETESWPNEADCQPSEPRRDGQSPDRKPRDKPVKKIRFAAETTDINSEVAAKARKSEDSGTCEGCEGEEDLPTAGGKSNGISDALGSGCSTGRHSHFSTRPHRQSPPTQEVQSGEGQTLEPCALGNTASYNIGDLLPGARSGRHKSHKPSQDQDKSPETTELGDFTAGGGDFGYNVGTLPSSHKSRHAEIALHATQREAPETPESRELNNITLESGEFGYNVGNLPSSHPDRHKVHRRRPEDGGAGRTAESEELGSITMGKGEFGFNVGKGENDGEKENPSHSEQTAGTDEQTVGANETQETEELANIAIGEDDFGYNVGKGKSDGEENPNAADARLHSDQIAYSGETKETEELANITMGEGEFGYNIGEGESGKGKENSMTSEAQNYNEQVAGTGNMRGSGYYGHVNGQSPKTGSTTRTDNTANGTLQDYLHSLLSLGAKPLSPPTSTHASEVLELTEHLPDQQSQTVTITELRTVLADFKSDLLTSITAESRLQKVESDIDFIRKQLSSGGNITTPTHNAANGIKGAPRGPPEGDVRERILTWGFIIMAVITAISLAVLWGVTTNHITTREGVSFGDRIVEWLLMQGRKG